MQTISQEGYYISPMYRNLCSAQGSSEDAEPVVNISWTVEGNFFLTLTLMGTEVLFMLLLSLNFLTFRSWN